MRTIRLTMMSMVMVWMTACSTISDWFAADTLEPPAPLPDIANVKKFLAPLWAKSTGVGAHYQFLRLRPAILADKIVVANADGEVSAYNYNNGEQLWRIETEIALTGGVGGSHDLMVIGGNKGEVIALNVKDGKKRWQVMLSSEVLAPPAVGENVIVVRTIDGRVVGLNAIDGNRLWVFSHTVPVLSLRGTSTPLIVQDVVYIGLDSGQIVALDLHDGHRIWETVVAVPKGRSELERMVDIDADLVSFGDNLYVAAAQGRVMAIDLISGQARWSREISSIAGLGVDQNYVYVTDEESILWCLERSTGAALWRQEALRYRSLTAPTQYNNTVIVGDVDGYLHILNQDDGKILGRFYLEGNPILTAPLIQNTVLYAVDGEGNLAALKTN